MKKAKKELEVVLKELDLAPEAKADTKITPLTVDFGRADLNELRDKINEIISRG